MSELLVLAQSMGARQRGDIVEVRAADAPVGAAEGLPRFVRARFAGMTMADLKPYCRAWSMDLDFEILEHDAAQDRYSGRFFNRSMAADGTFSADRPEVAGIILAFTGTLTARDGVSIYADFRVWEGFCSAAHWVSDQGVDGVVFTLESYDAATGAYRARIDYGAQGLNPTFVESALAGRGYTVVGHSDRVLTVDFTSALLVALFRDIAQRTTAPIRQSMSRFRLSEEALLAAEAAGGVVDLADTAGLIAKGGLL